MGNSKKNVGFETAITVSLSQISQVPASGWEPGWQ